MLSKRYKSTEVDRRTWLQLPSGTPWSTSSVFNASLMLFIMWKEHPILNYYRNVQDLYIFFLTSMDCLLLLKLDKGGQLTSLKLSNREANGTSELYKEVERGRKKGSLPGKDKLSSLPMYVHKYSVI